MVQPTFAGQDGPVCSVVVGVGRALPPTPRFPLRGVVHCDTYCCAVQVLLIGGRGPIHPLAGLHVACWHVPKARLSYDIPNHTPLFQATPLLLLAIAEEKAIS